MTKKSISKKDMREFFRRLEGKEGCNFRKDKDGKILWNCNRKSDRPLAHRILRKMNISTSLQEIFLSECLNMGGACDCELLFNSRAYLLPEYRRELIKKNRGRTPQIP